jgi:hypothetical protein
MDHNEPTLGEVLRRLDDVSRELKDVLREMKDDRAANAATYVRRDVYLAERTTIEANVADLHGDIKKGIADLHRDIEKVADGLGREVKSVKEDRKNDINFRRQVWLALGTVALTLLVTIVLSVINLLAR